MRNRRGALLRDRLGSLLRHRLANLMRHRLGGGCDRLRGLHRQRLLFRQMTRFRRRSRWCLRRVRTAFAQPLHRRPDIAGGLAQLPAQLMEEIQIIPLALPVRSLVRVRNGIAVIDRAARRFTLQRPFRQAPVTILDRSLSQLIASSNAMEGSANADLSRVRHRNTKPPSDGPRAATLHASAYHRAGRLVQSK